MTIGILGSGNVGVALAKGFLSEGHEVHIATREPESDKGLELRKQLSGATVSDFASVAQAAEVAFLCVDSEGLEDTIHTAGADNLAGKIVIDTTNVIKQENGQLVYAGKEISAAEQVQAWLPDSRVVKAFNTVGAATMYKPDFGDLKPTMFIAGNDTAAKQQVAEIVTMFGWEPLNTGELPVSRTLEPMALIWINNSMATGSPHHAFKML
jgi:predicted dinucleotide-binding enzyme